jgi:hypothetical protein
MKTLHGFLLIVRHVIYSCRYLPGQPPPKKFRPQTLLSSDLSPTGSSMTAQQSPKKTKHVRIPPILPCPQVQPNPIQSKNTLILQAEFDMYNPYRPRPRPPIITSVSPFHPKACPKPLPPLTPPGPLNFTHLAPPPALQLGIRQRVCALTKFGPFIGTGHKARAVHLSRVPGEHHECKQQEDYASNGDADDYAGCFGLRWFVH